MSDRVESTVREMESGRNITRSVNEGMTRQEQLQFSRRLWENGGSATPSGKGSFTKVVGDAEVTFRTGKDGEREVSDIMFRGTKDLYDTPEEVRARAGQAESARQAGPRTASQGIGSPGDTRYRDTPEQRGATGSDATRTAAQDYQRCVDQGGPNRKVEAAVCAATSGHTPAGARMIPVTEAPRKSQDDSP